MAIHEFIEDWRNNAIAKPEDFCYTALGDTMKENVLIGKLIPAGTGMKRYRSIKLNTDVEEEDDIDLAEDDFNEPAELDEADKIVLNEDELSEE